MKKEKQIKCEECKHWVDKSDMQEVEIKSELKVKKTYYCPPCKKPYTRVYIDSYSGYRYSKNEEVAVNKNGESFIEKELNKVRKQLSTIEKELEKETNINSNLLAGFAILSMYAIFSAVWLVIIW